MAVDRPDLTFAELGVPLALTERLAALGITVPTPIQASTLPDSLAGRDVLGRGRTGSGKTYGFLLPLVARLAESASRRAPHRPRALILAPTRELAAQIDASLAPLAKAAGLTTVTVFGGVGANPQIAALRRGVDVVVACPGRLNDLVEGGHAKLDAVEITVLDEADHMADLGFLPVVRRLMERTPAKGQRLLFSATLGGGVDVLVRQFMHRPVTHSVDTETPAVSTMEHHVLQLRREDRLPVLAELTSAPGRTIVFTRTKYGAKKLARQLVLSGIPAVELHGNLAQNARNRSLQAFADGTTATLVATDIAARGIHVDDVALVIHADPPAEYKAYLHRSGRTARAGAAGKVVTIATDEQLHEVRSLTKQAGVTPVTTRVRPGDTLLSTIAPGERSRTEPPVTPAPTGRRRAEPAVTAASGGRRRAEPAVTASSGGRRRAEPAVTAASGGRRRAEPAVTAASGGRRRAEPVVTTASGGRGRAEAPVTAAREEPRSSGRRRRRR